MKPNLISAVVLNAWILQTLLQSSQVCRAFVVHRFPFKLLAAGLYEAKPLDRRRTDGEVWRRKSVKRLVSLFSERLEEGTRPSELSMKTTDEGELIDSVNVSDDGEVEASQELGPLEVDLVVPLVSLDDLNSAFSSNVSYFYLRNELGLSEEAMCRITFEAGSALGMTAQTIRHKVDTLRQAMNLTDSEIRSLLECQPSILHLSADDNILPTLVLLQNLLNLDTDNLRELVLSSPSIITNSESTINSKIRFFTSELGFTTEDTCRLLQSEPKLLRAGVKTGLVPRLRFLTKELDLPLDRIRKVVESNPLILLYSVENNLIPKLVFFLILTLGMDPPQVQRLLVSFPAFVNYNLDNHILPIAEFFFEDLEFRPTELRRILLKFPRLVTYSLSRIKRTVGYFRYQMSMTAPQVKRVLFQAPQVIGLKESHIQDKVDFLRDSFALTEDQVKQVIAGMPTLLVLSITNTLQPKREYLISAFDGNVEAIGAAVLKLPALLGYSLDKRMRPRLEAIRRAGLDSSRITVAIPMKQKSFEGWLQRRAEKERMEEQPAMVPSAPPSMKSRVESDRIVHWTRGRRRQPPKRN